jgi:hypothetical protein
VDPTLTGTPRFNLLARRSLVPLAGGALGPSITPTPPLVLASCNGGAAGFEFEAWRDAFDSRLLLAGTPWQAAEVPVVSASCASGMHAVFLATRLLAAGHPEVVVLAADTLSPSSYANFESLRVLAEAPATPWQAESTGFVAGEAAVALRLRRASPPAGPALARIEGPTLAQDLDGSGLRRALAPHSAGTPDLLLGLGTGPHPTDSAELAALDSFPRGVPLATALAHFGHTLGASGPLSLALAILAARAGRSLPALRMPAARAMDGRPLWDGGPGPRAAVVACRALSGACAAIALSFDQADPVSPSTSAPWTSPAPSGPLLHPLLRLLAAQALERRPTHPPAMVVARLETPLAPPPAARVGGRLLPSAVVEITPGFVPQLVARAWGFTGPALCLVGGAEAEVEALIEASRRTAGPVAVVALRGSGEERDVEWELRS